MLIKLIKTEQDLVDLIFTLEISIKSLPPDAHPVHQKRLRKLIEDLEDNITIEQEEDINILDDEVLLEIFDNNYGKLDKDSWNGEKIIEELFDRGYELEL